MSHCQIATAAYNLAEYTLDTGHYALYAHHALDTMQTSAHPSRHNCQPWSKTGEKLDRYAKLHTR